MFLRRSNSLVQAAVACGLLVSITTGLSSAQSAHRPRVAFLFETSEKVSPALITKAAAPFRDRLLIDALGITAGSAALPAGADLASYDLVIAQLGGGTEALVSRVKEAMQHTKVIVIGSVALHGNVALTHPEWPQEDWANLSTENLASLIRLAESDVLHVPDEPASPPVAYPNQAFYHPAAPRFFPTLAEYLDWYRSPGRKGLGYTPHRCTIGVLFYYNYYTQQNLDPFDALLREIEADGCNAVGLMTQGAPKLGILRLPDGTPFVDVLLYNGERINLQDYEDGVKEADALGVPVLGVYLDYRQSRQQYLKSSGGLAPGMSGALTDAEQDGIFEPLMVGSRNHPHDPNAAFELLPEQIRWRVGRAAAWARLRHKSNREKRVVFTYWSEGGGKSDIGGDPDDFLDVPSSLVSLLHAMKSAGYDTGNGSLPSRDELVRRMSEEAANVGTWAPADLAREVKAGHAILIPEREYRTWFDRLPESLRASVIEQWGPPPGNVMVHVVRGQKYLVIPALAFGNILLAPHPDWGYLQSRKALMSTGALAPHHQYLAFFLWLQNQWKADAWVSLFTNIVLQSGKSEGPYVEDAEGVLLGNIPHIHPERLGAAGGISDKRKSLALTDGWFRGAVSADIASLYRNLRMLAQAAATDASKAPALRSAIAQAGLRRALGANDETAPADQLARSVLQYLDELDREMMPHGSHVLGNVPTGSTLVDTVLAMLVPEIDGRVKRACPADCLQRMARAVVLEEADPLKTVSSVTGTEDAQLVRLMQNAAEDAARVRQGGREIGAILDALEGRRLTPGPADDPLRRSDALPAGRSLFSFDAAAIPTREVELLGIAAANATIEKFQKDHGGQFPEKLGFVLWASELSANGGVTEAEILSLLGVRPVRDARDHVVDLQLIPREELKRPRVDVLASASGLYRDHYANLIDLIQRAVALAQASPEADNPIRQNSQRAKNELLKSSGSTKDVEQLSAARVFSEAPNAYSPSTQFLAKSGDLRGDDKTMVRLYNDRMNHAYGIGEASGQSDAAFTTNLAQMQAAFMSRSDPVNGLLDQPMVAAYLGGLNMAAKDANGGSDVSLYIDTIRKGELPKIEDTSHVIERELQSKYLNPAWIKAMQASGYDGARYMTEMTDNLSLWNTTARRSVESDTWESVKRVYVDDQYGLGIKEYFEKNNPYARQVMLATLLDAVTRGYWRASEEEKRLLAGELAQSASAHGLAGTADLNRNSALTRMVAGAIAGLPGSDSLMRGYRNALQRAGSVSSQPAASAPVLPPHSSAPALTSSFVTGSVLQKVVPQIDTSRKRLDHGYAIAVCLIAGALLLLGWIRAGKDVARGNSD